MELYYHSDICPKVFGAFKCNVGDPTTAFELTEGLAMFRLEHLKATEDNAATQVTKTLYAAMATNLLQENTEPQTIYPKPDTTAEHILCAPYQPETLDDQNVKELLLSMCAKGRFIPFILAVDKHDAESDKNVAVFVAGIGEHPDVNFMLVTLNIPGIIEKMGIKFKDDDDSDLAHLIYPLSFDVPNKCVTAVFTSEYVHARTFIMQTEAMEENNETATEQSVEES